MDLTDGDRFREGVGVAGADSGGGKGGGGGAACSSAGILIFCVYRADAPRGKRQQAETDGKQGRYANTVVK